MQRQNKSANAHRNVARVLAKKLRGLEKRIDGKTEFQQRRLDALKTRLRAVEQKQELASDLFADQLDDILAWKIKIEIVVCLSLLLGVIAWILG